MQETVSKVFSSITGIDRLCVCSDMGKLYFYQLSEEIPEKSDSMVEGETSGVIEIPDLNFLKDTSRSEDLLEQCSKGGLVIIRVYLIFSQTSPGF